MSLWAMRMCAEMRKNLHCCKAISEALQRWRSIEVSKTHVLIVRCLNLCIALRRCVLDKIPSRVMKKTRPCGEKVGSRSFLENSHVAVRRSNCHPSVKNAWKKPQRSSQKASYVQLVQDYPTCHTRLRRCVFDFLALGAGVVVSY